MHEKRMNVEMTEAESVCIQIKVTLTQSSKSHRSKIVQFEA